MLTQPPIMLFEKKAVVVAAEAERVHCIFNVHRFMIKNI